MKKILTIFLVFIIGYGCVPSSHLIVGKLRTPINPSEVIVLLDFPEKYEKIALIETTSQPAISKKFNFSFAFTEQQKLDLVITRLIDEAAKLGANGIVINKTENQTDYSVSINYKKGKTRLSQEKYKIGVATAIYIL